MEQDDMPLIARNNHDRAIVADEWDGTVDLYVKFKDGGILEAKRTTWDKIERMPELSEQDQIEYYTATPNRFPRDANKLTDP